MENQFVPHEIAVQLKELGFKETCLGFFIKDRLSYPFLTNNETYLRVPLWQQAFDFFREKYDIVTFIEKYKNLISSWDDEEYLFIKEFKYTIPQTLNITGIIVVRRFKTYEEAREACLLKLIELCN